MALNHFFNFLNLKKSFFKLSFFLNSALSCEGKKRFRQVKWIRVKQVVSDEEVRKQRIKLKWFVYKLLFCILYTRPDPYGNEKENGPSICHLNEL